MGLFSGGWHDQSVYPVEHWQKRNLSDLIYGNLGSQWPNMGNWLGGSGFGDWMNKEGLSGLLPGGGGVDGLDWSKLTGGIDMSNPDWMNSLGIRWASPGHATASLVDLNAQPFRTDMDPKVEADVLGGAHRTLDAQTAASNRALQTQGALSGMSPAAMAYLAQQNRQSAADSLGGFYGQFETSWVQNALQRQAAARELNANLETHVSELNAQLDTQASDVNAQLSERLAEFGSGQSAAAAKALLGLWQNGQTMDLDRAKLLEQMMQFATSPTGTMKQDPGLLQQIEGLAGPLASIMQIPGLNPFAPSGGGDPLAGVGATGGAGDASTLGGSAPWSFNMPGPVSNATTGVGSNYGIARPYQNASQNYFNSSFNPLDFGGYQPWMDQILGDHP